MTKCLNCGNETTNPKFCSMSCSASFNNKGVARNPKKEWFNGFCEECGNALTGKTQTKFCSSYCHHKNQKDAHIKRFLNGELSDNSIRRKVIREFLIERQNGECSICNCEPEHNGKPLIFVIDHVDGNFMNSNHENIRAICPNCNSQTDTFTGKNKRKNEDRRIKKNYRKTN